MARGEAATLAGVGASAGEKVKLKSGCASSRIVEIDFCRWMLKWESLTSVPSWFAVNLSGK